jgi:hypothetical protein
LPFRSVPSCRINRGRFHTTNRSHSLQTPPQPLPVISFDNKQEIHQLFCQQSSEELQLAERVRLRKKVGQSCIDLDDSQNECEHPDFPILGVDALLLQDRGVSIAVVVVNLMPKIEMVDEWLGVFEAHIFTNPRSACDTLLCHSLIDQLKHSIGSHELHNVTLSLHTKYLEVCSIQGTWEAIGLASFLLIKMQ